MRNQPPVPEPLLLDERVTGQTFLSKFASCPRDAYLYRKHRVETHQMIRGTVFHGGIQRATEYMIEEGADRMPGEVARDYVEGYLADHPEYALPEHERDALRLMGWNWGEATVLDLEHLIGAEVEIHLVINGWLIRCRVDLIYRYPDFVGVEDYKTSLNMIKNEDAEKDFQAKFYSLAVLEGIQPGDIHPIGAGLNDVDFTFKYPRFRDDETGTLIGRGAPFTRMDLQDFKVGTLMDVLNKVEYAYEHQVWKAYKHDRCNYCAARSLCPIPQELHDFPAITNLAEAQEHGENFVQLTEARKVEQKSLKDWIAENGPLFVGEDVVLDIVATEKKSTKWAELEPAVDRAVQFGEPFDLSKYRTTQHGTKFTQRKRTEEEKRADEGE